MLRPCTTWSLFMLICFIYFFSVMSIIGQVHKHAARWTITLSTEVLAVGMTVGKTEQAGRNLLLVFGSNTYRMLPATPTKVWGVFVTCLVRIGQIFNLVLRTWKQTGTYRVYNSRRTFGFFVSGGGISFKLTIWNTPSSSGISIQGTPPS